MHLSKLSTQRNVHHMIQKAPHQRFKVGGIDATLDGLLLERQDYADNHASHTARAIPCSCPFDTVHDLSGTAWRVCSRYGLPNSVASEVQRLVGVLARNPGYERAYE
jgi:hypothetical protein